MEHFEPNKNTFKNTSEKLTDQTEARRYIDNNFYWDANSIAETNTHKTNKKQ